MLWCFSFISGWAVEAGGSGDQGQSQLHSQSEASLGYMPSFLKKKNKATTNQWERVYVWIIPAVSESS